MSKVLSLEEFVAELCNYWRLETADIDVHRPLEELGIDSLGKLELIVMLEDFGGHEMPDELWSESTSLVDIYSCYEVYASRDRLEMHEVPSPTGSAVGKQSVVKDGA